MVHPNKNAQSKENLCTIQ